ncbi:hypothetical protein [Streptomyces shenzhenensis]|uniref:hypothetical protein n=1 Tax=Streptomyces shenzhenensis TaxID=943815 RepID=UPI0033D84981
MRATHEDKGALFQHGAEDVVHVCRVSLRRFRGFTEAEIAPQGHAVLVGEPRAGRSDLIAAMRRVLDPRAGTAPNLDDVQRPFPEVAEDEVIPPTEVEVTLLGLGPELEQDLYDRLELIDVASGLPADEGTVSRAQLGVRLRYRLTYDERLGDPEHAWEYPKTGRRVPRGERLALAAVVIGPGTPLQLRSGSAFRRMVSDLDSDELAAALKSLAMKTSTAVGALADVKAVQEGIRSVLHQGAAQLLELPDTDHPEEAVGFVADDGSVEALLRRLQPDVTFDESVGALPLSLHGSSTAGILRVAEAMVTADIDGAIVLADDFGDDIDAGAAEYLAALLRRRSGQVWLSTRRPDVVRAFAPTDVLRLTRSHGERRQHQLAPTTDRKERLARRQLHQLLIPAMTTRVVALLEGPHDQEALSAVAQRRLDEDGVAPPAAHGIRLTALGLGDGGKNQLPKLASLASDLGFHVRVVVDNDKPGADSALIAELVQLAEQVIRFPERTAIERALVRGLPVDTLRSAMQEIKEVYGLSSDFASLPDSDVEKEASKQLKQKGGLHHPFVDALPEHIVPPLIAVVLDVLNAGPAGAVLLELDNPQGSP